MGIRSAFLEGNLTRDPEARPVGEWTVVNFSIACNESMKQQDGTYKDKPHFFDCEYWTKKPQYWLSNMAKGKGVVCECEPIQDRWEQDGQARSKVKFKLTKPPVLRSSAQNAMDKHAEPAAAEQGNDKFEDDIPFN